MLPGRSLCSPEGAPGLLTTADHALASRKGRLLVLSAASGRCLAMKDNSAKDTNETKDPKEKLDQLLAAAEEKGRRVARVGRKVTEEGQRLADVAGATRKVIKYAKYIPDLENSIAYWEAVNQNADSLLARMNPDLIVPLVSSTSTATISSTTIIRGPEVYLDVEEASRPALTDAIADLSNVISKASTQDEVASLMRSLGLHTSAPGRKSALQQFHTAHESFTNPNGDSKPVITSLIPMREAIRLTIDELLRRRPKQERTPRWWDKIMSIGNQLSYPSISLEQIKSWASICMTELDVSLSPAKDQAITREEWSRRLTTATLFLKSFLSGIDPAKIR
jgi:hypothetical protein